MAQQLDLFSGKPAKYRFAVMFYTPERGDFWTETEISRNDKRVAIATAAKQLGLKHYQQASAQILPPKGSS